MKKIYEIYPIGEVIKSGDYGEILIFDKYRLGLNDLEDFSHLKLIWWFDRNDISGKRGKLTAHPPIAGGLEVGVFASRSPHRPNLLGINVCRIEKIDLEKGLVFLDYIEAFEKTPIIDIKPYIPRLDRAEAAQIPDWLKR